MRRREKSYIRKRMKPFRRVYYCLNKKGSIENFVPLDLIPSKINFAIKKLQTEMGIPDGMIQRLINKNNG